jgi:hypothetical protein
MRRGILPFWLAFSTLFLALTSCEGGTPTPRALGEPLRVSGGAFHAGALPGHPPTSDDATDVEPLPGPAITALDNANNTLRPGQVGKALSGRASPETLSVALRFADLGSGYWVVPVGNADPLQGGEVAWETMSELSWDVSPGLHPFRLVAIDGEGHAGTQREVSFCVRNVVEDNGNACHPRLAPPYAVIALRWDSDVDLDLQVRVPNGKLVGPKAPTSVPAVAGAIGKEALSDPSIGVLDRDSNASCVLDGIRQESLVFQEKPTAGLYQIYASLAAGCGASSVRFSAALYLRRDLGDGQFGQEKVLEQGGFLSAEDDLPTTPGTFVKELVLP